MRATNIVRLKIASNHIFLRKFVKFDNVKHYFKLENKN